MDETPDNWLVIPTRREVISRLERTPFSADAKVILEQLLDTTVTVGSREASVTETSGSAVSPFSRSPARGQV